jgi:3-oxochol-4-en-24-oyl-CoA dehydrogenase
VPTALTPDQLALQASMYAAEAAGVATERVAIGTGPDEAVQELLASDLPDFYTERAGLHVAATMSIAALGERGARPAIRKLIGTAHRQAVAETLLDLLGPDGLPR